MTNKKKHNANWENNHHAIRQAFLALQKEKMKYGEFDLPTCKEVAEVVGMNPAIVQRHIKGLDLHVIAERSTVKLLLEPVLVAMAKKGIDGDCNAAKLYIEKAFPDGATNTTINKVDLTSKGKEIDNRQSHDIFIVKDGAWQEEVEKLKQKLQGD